ncbi:hypothetical protein [Dethiothermospora halolimnae]|uniref:hypothetical protein n=1 Tax=Dethiothermospora halolimnae TaxID=3114390 RepID=UPI003CCBD278
MEEENKNIYNDSLLKHKYFKLFILIPPIITILVVIATYYANKDLNLITLSDNLFVVSVAFTIMSLIFRSKAWRIHKQSVLKHIEKYLYDYKVERAKITFKVLLMVGIFNLVFAIIFLII